MVSVSINRLLALLIVVGLAFSLIHQAITNAQDIPDEDDIIFRINNNLPSSGALESALAAGDTRPMFAVSQERDIIFDFDLPAQANPSTGIAPAQPPDTTLNRSSSGDVIFDFSGAQPQVEPVNATIQLPAPPAPPQPALNPVDAVAADDMFIDEASLDEFPIDETAAFDLFGDDVAWAAAPVVVEADAVAIEELTGDDTVLSPAPESTIRAAENTDGNANNANNERNEIADVLMLSGDDGLADRPLLDPVCETLERSSSGAMVANGTLSNVVLRNTTGDVHCRIINLNGITIAQLPAASINTLIDRPVMQAVDMFGMLEDGSPVIPFIEPAQVCLRGLGDVFFLGAATARQSADPLAVTEADAMYTCVDVASSGTVVLVSGAPEVALEIEPSLIPAG
jgi:hypothetical protein